MAVLRSSKPGNPQAAFVTVWMFEAVERALRTLKTIDLKVHPHTPSTPRPSARAHSALNHANLRTTRTAAASLHRLGAVDSEINLFFPRRMRLEYQQRKAGPVAFQAWQERTV